MEDIMKLACDVGDNDSMVTGDKSTDHVWRAHGPGTLRYVLATVLKEKAWGHRPDLSVPRLKAWIWARAFAALPPWLSWRRQLPPPKAPATAPFIFPLAQ